MAKKILNDPSEGNKNLGVQNRGVGVIFNSPAKQQKEKEGYDFDTKDTKPFTLHFPANMFKALKFEICMEEGTTMRNVILQAIKDKYGEKYGEKYDF